MGGLLAACHIHKANNVGLFFQVEMMFLRFQFHGFYDGLLDCPHYTRPETFQGEDVPDVLVGGHHEKIRRWRLKQSLGRTWQRRPDLLEGKQLSKEEKGLLEEFVREQSASG